MLLAGAIVERLTRTAAGTPVAATALRLNDQAAIARAAWAEAGVPGDRVAGSAALSGTLLNTRGGRNLTALHLDRDLVDAAQIDHCPLVPRLIVAESGLRIVSV